MRAYSCPTVAHLGDCTVMRPCPCLGHVYFPHRGLKGLSMFDSHRVRGDQRGLVVGVVGHVFFCCERDSGRVGNVRVANNACTDLRSFLDQVTTDHGVVPRSATTASVWFPRPLWEQ